MAPEDEIEGWYHASNMFTPSKEGISIQDFESGREVIKEIMHRYRGYMTFKPLIQSMFMRMM